MCDYKYTICHMIEEENIFYTSLFLITTHTDTLDFLLLLGKKQQY